MASLDLEKAFDHVLQQLIWYALHDHGVQVTHNRGPDAACKYQLSHEMHCRSFWKLCCESWCSSRFNIVMDIISTMEQLPLPICPSSQCQKDWIVRDQPKHHPHTSQQWQSSEDQLLPLPRIYKVTGASRVKKAWFQWKEITSVLCDQHMPICLKSKV